MENFIGDVTKVNEQNLVDDKNISNDRFVTEIPLDKKKSETLKNTIRVKKALDILCVNEPGKDLLKEHYQLQGVVDKLAPDIKRITIGTDERVYVDNPEHGFQMSTPHFVYSKKKVSARQAAKEMLLSTKLSDFMLNKLQNKRITHKLTGIIYQLLVPIDTDEEKLKHAGKRRYGKDVLTINDKQFFLTNDIYMRNLEPLSKLLSKSEEEFEDLI
jgi:hypothetical protein